MAHETNPGPALCVLDIADGMSREEVRRKWLAGDYGPEGKRPKAEHVDGYLKMEGR